MPILGGIISSRYMNCITSAEGEQPELVSLVEGNKLDKVGLRSMNKLGSGTQDMKKGWSLLYSGVFQREKHRTGVGVLTTLNDLALEFSSVNQTMRRGSLPAASDCRRE